MHLIGEGVNFSRWNILNFGALLILLPAMAQGWVPWKWLFVLLALYLIVLGWGVFDIGSQFFIKTYWKGTPGRIAFTFDDGPDPKVTPRVLDVLRKANVKAAFFVTGKNAEQHPELLRQMHREGHVIGNHTYHHAYVFSKAAAIKQLSDGQHAISAIIGKTPRYFRPPFGVMTPEIAWAVTNSRNVVVGWDLRSRDGVGTSAQTTVNRVSKRLSKATILLFHDTNPTTPEAVEQIIDLCRKNGMKIVSLPEQLGIPPYHE